MSPLSSEEKLFLLRLARQALSASVERGQRVPSGGGLAAKLDLKPAQLTPALQQPAGAFVSLHKGGELRGCVGFVEPRLPLYRAVMETAAAAALRDPRFAPVRPEELPALEIEISVLSPSQPVTVDAIEIGVHGLLVSQGRARGLLLPQVAVERRWSPHRFLEETCHKAGLPFDAWRSGARVEAFRAEVFGEKSQSNASDE